MRRLLFAGSLLLALASRGLAAEPRTPNVVLILMDDLGWADVGCYGSTFYETPNTDKLAAQGMRFTNAYAAGCVCSPTRASIMCGKYPARLHLTDFLTGRSDRPSQKLLRPKVEQKLSLDEISLARALKPAGYVTASIGKWHLGGPEFSPEKHGFDVNIGGSITGSPPGGYFKFKAPNLTARNDEEYLTDRLSQEAEVYIEKNKDKPFFLYLAHYAVHIPLQGKKDLIEKYEKKDKPAKGQNNAIYAAMVQSMDESVGRVMKKLDELKLADNTVVIFTSDNGGLSVKEGPNTPSTDNAPLRAGKGYLYEGGIREPFIVRWPGVVKAGSVCDVPVSSQDLYPTILQLAGVKPAEGQVIDGESLVPLWKQTGKPAREALYWHYPHYSNQGGTPSGAVRRGDYKLIEFYEDDHVELYNLKDDVGEGNDLARKQPDEAARLRKMLADWRKAMNAQMPTPNPDYKP
jgi:arylsulfatase A-like enzyme